jgi:hypothetical protein
MRKTFWAVAVIAGIATAGGCKIENHEPEGRTVEKKETVVVPERTHDTPSKVEVNVDK